MVIYIWIIGACEDWSKSMYVISYMFWFNNLLFLNLWLPLPIACNSFVRPCCSFWKFLSTMLGSPKKKKKINVMQKVEVFKNMKLPSVLFLFHGFWLRRSMLGEFKPFSTIKAIAACKKTPHLENCHFVPFLLSPLGLY